MFTVMDSKYFGGNPFYFLLNVRRFAALKNVRFFWSTLHAASWMAVQRHSCSK